MKKIIIAVVVLIGLAAAATFAQETGEFAGKVDSINPIDPPRGDNDGGIVVVSVSGDAARFDINADTSVLDESGKKIKSLDIADGNMVRIAYTKTDSGDVAVEIRKVGSSDEAAAPAESIFVQVARQAAVKDGVREITYEQFVKIGDSDEPNLLLDVLPGDSYAKGHIPGALSFPIDTINSETAAAKIRKGTKIVVYCGSFQCPASTEAAKKLTALGYDVLDYKGGIKEWREKGNKLVK